MSKLDKLALFASVGYRPHDIQRAVHASTASRRTFCAGVRVGKSTLCVHEVLAAMLQPGPASRGWIVTPSASTTELIVTPLLALLRTNFAHRIVELDERERRAVVRNLGGGLAEVVGKTADRPAALLGESLSWVIVDEAARLPAEVWETLSQRLVDRRGWSLVCSTPKGTNNWFHREYIRGARGDEGYQAWSAPTWSNPAIDPATVLLERSRLTPRAFAAEYGAAFIGEQGIECAACGWNTGTQRTTVSAAVWRACRRCDACGRTITESGEPIGFERADGTLGMTVIRGPEDDEVVINPTGERPGAGLTT
jgi:hypothetical protein